MEKWDLIVIGSGPAGQRAAIQAAKFGKRVALIEKLEMIGGTAINTGTIPSKTIREAVVGLPVPEHLRRELPGEGTHHDVGPVVSGAERDQDGD